MLSFVVYEITAPFENCILFYHYLNSRHSYYILDILTKYSAELLLLHNTWDALEIASTKHLDILLRLL